MKIFETMSIENNFMYKYYKIMSDDNFVLNKYKQSLHFKK